MAAPLPCYTVEYYRAVKICLFEYSFSQSCLYFSNEPRPSNACTVIAVLTAGRLNDTAIRISRTSVITEEFIQTYRDSMLFGNEIYHINKASGQFRMRNITLPEAIKSLADHYPGIVEWKSELFYKKMSENLYQDLKNYIVEWRKSPQSKERRNFYAVLIAEERTVLFVFQDGKVALLDSHTHGDYGAIVAECPEERLKDICGWYCSMLYTLYKINCSCYELTGIYFQSERSKSTKAGLSSTAGKSSDTACNVTEAKQSLSPDPNCDLDLAMIFEKFHLTESEIRYNLKKLDNSDENETSKDDKENECERTTSEHSVNETISYINLPETKYLIHDSTSSRRKKRPRKRSRASTTNESICEDDKENEPDSDIELH